MFDLGRGSLPYGVLELDYSFRVVVILAKAMHMGGYVGYHGVHNITSMICVYLRYSDPLEYPRCTLVLNFVVV